IGHGGRTVFPALASTSPEACVRTLVRGSPPRSPADQGSSRVLFAFQDWPEELWRSTNTLHFTQLGRNHVEPPFFSGAKVPSVNAVSHCNRRRLSSSATNAHKVRSHVPSSSVGYGKSRERGRVNASVIRDHNALSSRGTGGYAICQDHSMPLQRSWPLRPGATRFFTNACADQTHRDCRGQGARWQGPRSERHSHRDRSLTDCRDRPKG